LAFIQTEDGKGLPRQRRETHDGVNDQAEGAELVFLSFAVALAQLATLSVENGPGERVPALGPVELGGDPPTVGLVVEVGEQVEGLGDPAELATARPSGVGRPPPSRTARNS